MVDKYKDYTVKDLKKDLKSLKSTNDKSDEIKYVSHILLAKLRSNNNNQSSELCRDNSHNDNQTLNHDRYIEKNFWGYLKNILN